MANKRNIEARAREEEARRKAKFGAATKNFIIFPIITIALCAVLALTFFANWAEVFNTAAKSAEPPVFSGFKLIAATLSGNLKNTDDQWLGVAIYNAFVSGQLSALIVLTFIALGGIVANIALSVVTLITKNYKLLVPTVAVAAVVAICLFIAFGVAEGMGYPTMVGYKCNMSVCKFSSYIIYPALVATCAAVPSIVGFIKYLDAKKMVK